MQDGLQDAADPHVGSPTDYFTLQRESGSSDGPTSSRASSESDTSLQQLTGDVEECVNCLIRLVPVLRDPAPQDMYKGTVSHSEAHEGIELAKRTFPQATASLLRRLGVANWKRRHALLSLKLHDPTSTTLNRSSKFDRQRRPELRQSSMASVMNPSSWISPLSPQPLASSSASSHAARHPSMIVSFHNRTTSAAALEHLWLDRIRQPG